RAQPYVPKQIFHTFVEPHVAAFAAQAARRRSSSTPASPVPRPAPGKAPNDAPGPLCLPWNFF
ncbi:MAG: hypothetical protein ACK53V_04350, partial [Planctomycetota bacterium]